VPLIAVLFRRTARRRSRPAAELAAAGWHGVMLDTANKDAGGLRDWTDRDWLADFVHRARAAGLLVGLAGSLREDDVRPLAALGPDSWAFGGSVRRDRREECLDSCPSASDSRVARSRFELTRSAPHSSRRLSGTARKAWATPAASR